MARWLLCMALLFVSLAARAAETNHTVVLVMIDGFPARLLDNADTPNFDRLLPQSVWTDRLIPAFPSLSHTNWATLTTGCWPEKHGIVSNGFEIDGKPGERSEILDADTLIDCQPIHQVAESQGVRSAALGWTSSHSATRGQMASVVMPYFDEWKSENDIERARQVGALLDLPEAERPRLILAYFSGPDGAEHHNGVASAATRRAVENSDRGIGFLMERLDAFAETAPITLFVVTDHGMIDIHGLLNVTKLLAEAGVEARSVVDGPLGFVYLDDPSTRDAAAHRLSSDEHFDVVLPEAQPSYWRLGSSERLGDIMLYAKPGYFFPNDTDMPGWLPNYTRWFPAVLEVPSWMQRIGMHGYAVEEVPEMAGLFVAWGSGVGKPRKLESEVRAIDLHPTVARLLWIQPGTPVDGQVLEEMLAPTD